MIKRVLVGAKLTVLGVLLAGCGSSFQAELAPATGRAFGSVSYRGLPAEYRIYYAPVGSAASDREVIQVSGDPAQQRRGQIDAGNEPFSLDLPQGQYEIVLWEVAEGRAKIRPEEPLSVQFTVEPGRSVYIGRFNFAHPQGIRARASNVEVGYSNQLQQDVALLRSTGASIDLTEVQPGIDEGFSLQWSSDAGATDKALSLIVISSF